MDMRGLSLFISDIRKAATSKESEQSRIDKELAKIRAKFKEGGKLNGYDRKKYICKLLYMFMLGYEIDFGHMEAINLISSDKYSEKHIGYLACTLLLNENHELLTLITNSIKADLISNKEHFQCLALTAVANVGGKEFAEAMAQDVQKIVLHRDTKGIVRKKSALCLLRLYRKYPEIFTPETIVEPILELLGGVDFGVVNCLASLLLGFLAKDSAPFSSAVGKCIRVLSKIILSKDYTNDYVYYGVPAPWLQIKLFRILQHFPMPTDGALKNQITSVLNKIITASERIRSMDKSRTPSRNNAVNSVLIEAINLCIHYDKDRDLINMAANILGRFITDTKDTNLRYLGLATMSRLSYCSEGDCMEHIRKHQQTIVLSLKDADISIRKRALDLLFTMCDRSNAGEIVGELLEYLTVADFIIREDLVLKIAILAEKFAVEYSWYVDVILNIISQAGDFVSDDVYHRVVQIVTNNEEIQKHAADLVFKSVQSSAAHEVAVKVAGYILGEFGYYIADMGDSGPEQQLKALHSKFPFVSNQARATLLNTYIKFYNMYDNQALREKIIRIFAENKTHLDPEIQQRATEYQYLASNVREDVVNTVLENMPVYDIKQSTVLTAMQKAQGNVTDKDVWKEKEAQREAQSERSGRTIEDEEEEQAPVQAAAAAEEPDLLGGDDFLSAPAPTPAAPPKAAPVAADPLDDMFGSPTPSKPAAPAPAPAAPAAALGGLDDFLGGPSPAPAKPASAVISDIDDIFGAPAPAAAPSLGGMLAAPKGLTDAQQADVKAKFHALLMSDKGVVFEDANLQVGVKLEFHGPNGRATVFFGNKSAGSQVTGLSSNCLTPGAGARVHANQVAPMVAPKQQVQQLINMECVDLFDQAPRMELAFECDNQRYKFALDFPLVVAKFIEPYKITKDQFFNAWRNTPCTPNPPEPVVFTTNKPIDVEANATGLATGFRLHILRAVDNNNDNMVGCGQWISKAQPPVPVLVNVESNLQASAIRLTIKTPNPALAKALQHLLRAALGDKQL
eukprot:EG_transcript_1519